MEQKEKKPVRRIQKILTQLTPSNEYVPTLYRNPTASSTTFKYTLNHNNLLTLEQRQQYERNGYFVIKNLFHPKELEKYYLRFLAIANGEVERVPTMLVMRDVLLAKEKGVKGEEKVTKLQDYQDDEILFEYCKEPKVLKYVEAVIGGDIRSCHTMLINKPMDLGKGSSRHPPHQDLWYFPFRPAELIVCSWTAMQKIDQENGCLFVEPGTHTGPLYKHEYPADGIVNRAYHGIQGKSSEEDAKHMTHLEMEAGDTVFFHPLLVHGSGRNLSKRYRKAISCHYASSRCHFISVEGTIQQDVAREVEHLAKAKGLITDFCGLWKYKSRLIQGNDSKEWEFNL